MVENRKNECVNYFSFPVLSHKANWELVLKNRCHTNYVNQFLLYLILSANLTKWCTSLFFLFAIDD